MTHNYYEEPFINMIDSGTFWRCPHGITRFESGCPDCKEKKIKRHHAQIATLKAEIASIEAEILTLEAE